MIELLQTYVSGAIDELCGKTPCTMHKTLGIFPHVLGVMGGYITKYTYQDFIKVIRLV